MLSIDGTDRQPDGQTDTVPLLRRSPLKAAESVISCTLNGSLKAQEARNLHDFLATNSLLPISTASSKSYDVTHNIVTYCIKDSEIKFNIL